MTALPEYNIILFKSVSYALKAEKILKAEGIPFKLIPVPKHISSDCGICLRIEADIREWIKDVLEGSVEILEIRSL
ncbi:MAG: DUF3343 domain-containing protein [Deltaproteobacteria bacterium]|nr:DUF3343 domain-containing protein [Deltaproteobacteria bacterium]